MPTNRSVYMQQYRVRYGLTKGLVIPVDVLAKVIENEIGSRIIRPLSDWLGEDMTQTLLDVADDNK